MKFPAFPLALLLLCAACSSSSHPSDSRQAQAAPDVYFQPDLLPPGFLTPPMKSGDAEWKREQETVIAAQKQATEQDKKEIAFEEQARPDLVSPVLGRGYDRATLPATFRLLDKADATCESVVHADKDYWHTARPYNESHAVIPMVHALNNGSYPSGHATCSLVTAHVLGQLLPEKRDMLYAKAASIGWHRVMAGVHYPEDIRAGEQLSYMVYGALQSSPDYRSDVAAASREIGAIVH